MNKVYIASVFGRSQVFSSKEEAEKRLALFLRNHAQKMSASKYFTRVPVEQIVSSFAREEYGKTIEIWNKAAKEYLVGTLMQMQEWYCWEAKVEEHTVDSKLSEL